MIAKDFGYVLKNNICLFQKGPFSQWYGGWSGQSGGFESNKPLVNLFVSKFDGERLPLLTENPHKEMVSFNCCEQWMMATKALVFHDMDSYDKIIKATKPPEQKALGRKIKNYNQDAWDFAKYLIVLEGNKAKFSQNKDIREFLLSFHPLTIFAEAAPWDSVWGIGLAPDDPKAWHITTWEGENLLGVVIGDIRKGL